METQAPFQWRETFPGTYKRELDECEKFYRLCTRNESSCFPVTSSASFTVNTNARDSSKIEDAFRKAWLTLRYRHPTLASRVEHDAQTGQWLRVYNVGEDKEDQKTFSVHYASDALEWFNRDAPNFELASVYLVQSQTGNDSPWAVFLRCPHDITDGIGVLQLIDQLFVYAAQALEQGSEYAMPTWGDESVCLSPCLRAAAGIPDTLSSSQSQRLDDIKARNAALYNHERLLSLPSSRSSSSPSGRRERIPFPLSENTTREILTRCKRIGTGVSVTHVFMAALALVLAQLQSPRDTKEDAREFRYVNHSMINLRPYCQPPYNGPDHAAAAYHTISAQALAIDVDVNVTIPPSSPPDLAQAVCKVRDFFKETFSDTNSRSDQIAFACETFKSITPAPGADIHAVSETPFCPVPLSSLGNVSNTVARRHGAIEVQHVWAASEPIGGGVALFLGTWEGNLELSAVFDTRYHEREVVRVFLESIVRCVCDGLDVVFS